MLSEELSAVQEDSQPNQCPSTLRGMRTIRSNVLNLSLMTRIIGSTASSLLGGRNARSFRTITSSMSGREMIQTLHMGYPQHLPKVDSSHRLSTGGSAEGPLLIPNSDVPPGSSAMMTFRVQKGRSWGFLDAMSFRESCMKNRNALQRDRPKKENRYYY